MINRKTSSHLFIAFILFSCGGQDSVVIEEIKFKNAFFGQEQVTVNSLEHYRIEYPIYFRPADSDRKYSFGAQFSHIEPENPGIRFYYFPDDSLISHFEVNLIDTLRRDIDKLPPTQILTMLYVSPDVIAKNDFKTILEFIGKSYQQKEEDK